MATADRTPPKHRVLYVDDEKSLLNATQRYFNRRSNYAIDTAKSAQEGFRKIKTCQYDTIISDYEMPGVNGIEFLSRLRSDGNETPFIIFTGRGREEVVIDAFNAGADYYLRKGGNPRTQLVELHNTIEKAIENRRAKDEIRQKNAEIEAANRKLTRTSEDLKGNLDELTVRKKQLQESERRARSLLDASPSAIVLLDRNGIVLDSNDRYPALFKKTREEILGASLWDILPEQIVTEQKQRLLQVVATGKPLLAELSVDDIWEFSCYPVFDTDGHVESVTVYATDVTERRRMETEIRASETLYRTVVEDQTEFVCRFLPDGTHIFTNDAYCRYFGRTRQEFKNSKFKPDIPKDDQKEIGEMLRSLTPDNPVATIQHRIVMPGGTIRWQQWSDRAIFDEDGTVVEYQSVGRDITELKQVEHAILEANNKLNLLSSITRHDILNQLTALMMMEEFLKEDVTEEEPAAYVDAIIDVTNKIEEQIQFTRDYQDLGQLKPGWQNVQKTARDAFTRSVAYDIAVDIDMEGVFVYADHMLEKVFLNLYDNAVRHGERVTEIHVSFREDGDRGIITVRDNGDGVPSNMKDHIFDRYTGSNTGLGLFLVTEILAITGITIVENGVPGSGASFDIIVPEGRWNNTNRPAAHPIHRMR